MQALKPKVWLEEEGYVRGTLDIPIHFSALFVETQLLYKASIAKVAWSNISILSYPIFDSLYPQQLAFSVA
jgi:hypothetical protein